ncbi:MAG: pentapeptide repeat-containing protein [Bryobacteraceae bacterium]
MRADPTDASLLEANLSGTDLSEARLSGADFTGALLANALSGEAQMLTADLRNVNLQGARGFTVTQLSQARTDDRAILSNGRCGSFVKVSGGEKPR